MLLRLTSTLLLTTSAMAENALIPAANIAKHVGKFNSMEPETVVNAVPDVQSQAWLERNVPRFSCPDPKVEALFSSHVGSDIPRVLLATA